MEFDPLKVIDMIEQRFGRFGRPLATTLVCLGVLALALVFINAIWNFGVEPLLTFADRVRGAGSLGWADIRAGLLGISSLVVLVLLATILGRIITILVWIRMKRDGHVLIATLDSRASRMFEAYEHLIVVLHSSAKALEILKDGIEDTELSETADETLGKLRELEQVIDERMATLSGEMTALAGPLR